MTAGRLPHVSSTSARPQTAKSTYVSISLAVCNNRFDFTLCHNSGNLGKHMKTPWIFHMEIPCSISMESRGIFVRFFEIARIVK